MAQAAAPIERVVALAVFTTKSRLMAGVLPNKWLKMLVNRRV
jgi:hypothetical protein